MVHDGRITVGRYGAQRRNRTIDLTRNRFPELVGEDNKVHLEKIYTDGDNFNVDGFLVSLSKYCMVREQLREKVKTEKAEAGL